MRVQGDFHVHTNFCPHASNDAMEAYVTYAIDHHVKYLSFTEHAPLPETFFDPAPGRDSCMKWEDVETYITEGKRLQKKYGDQISIWIGFEVDYLVDREQETHEVLKHLGPFIEDAILSVHMLKAPNGEYVCLDYSEDEFARIIALFGSIEAVYNAYYDAVKQSIRSDLGNHKPKRIGHITLVQKFSKKFNSKTSLEQEKNISETLTLIKEKGYELDINTAGFFKTSCGVSYPPFPVVQQAGKMGIPLVLGSDSHQSNTISKGFDLLPSEFNFSLPQSR